MTVATCDHYSLLGVHHEATKDQIRAAYKKHALNHHPDKNPQGEDMFKKILNAYQTLASPTKRRKYDGEIYHCVRQHTGAASQYTSTHEKPTTSNAPPPPPPSGGPTRPAHRPSAYYQERKKKSDEEYNRHAKQFAEQNVNFSDWYRKKQDEWNKMETEAKDKAEILRKRMHEQMAAEEASREAQREREQRNRMERETLAEQRRLDAEKSAREHSRRVQEERERTAAKLAAEVFEVQKAQQETLEQTARDLARQRNELEKERKKHASEALKSELNENERKARDEKRMKLAEEEVLAAERRLAKAKAEQEEQKKRALEEEKRKLFEADKEQEELERTRRQTQEDEQAWNEKVMAQEFERKQSMEDMGKKTRKVILEVENARAQYQEELRQMRLQSEKVEEALQNKLMQLRAAKAAGKSDIEISVLREEFQSLMKQAEMRGAL